MQHKGDQGKTWEVWKQIQNPLRRQRMQGTMKVCVCVCVCVRARTCVCVNVGGISSWSHFGEEEWQVTAWIQHQQQFLMHNQKQSLGKCCQVDHKAQKGKGKCGGKGELKAFGQADWCHPDSVLYITAHSWPVSQSYRLDFQQSIQSWPLRTSPLDCLPFFPYLLGI